MEDESSLSAQLEQERKRRLIAEQQLQEQSAALAAAQAALHTLAADVEARVHARTAELSAHAARSHAILRTMRDGVVHIDPRGIILAVNDSVCDMFGYEQEELLGHNVNLLMPKPHREAHDGYLQRFLQTREIHIVGKRREFDGQHKNGHCFPIELAVNEMVDDAGSTLLGVIRNITEQRAANQAMQDALAAARNATETKSRFLANMSHEIRTPINAVLGFAELCLHLDLPARAQDYLEKIRMAATSLLGLINDILDFSKIEADKLEIESVPFSLNDTLQNVAGLFGAKAREKGIELAIGAQPNVPDRLLGDPLRLGQILTNLVGNAIKFTASGEIQLIVELAKISTGQVMLRFSVSDTGPGITPEQQTQLFSPFAQADSSTTRKHGGTGLGLAISKQLVERLNGTIHVRSALGQGSCFSFTACFGLEQAHHSPPATQAPLHNKKVLVVEDNAVVRTLLHKTMEAFGCRTASVGSGQEALDQLEAGKHFDLVLLDWHLPDVDGLRLAHRLRETGNPIPIILITGDDPESARDQIADNDIQNFLAKPVSRSSLLHSILHTLDNNPIPEKKGKAPPAPPNLCGKRVLVVDDNDFNRQVARELIVITGADVQTADDGLQAVAAASRGGFDLVLMDLQMPHMDGYSAAREIRRRYPDLPIVALTAHAMREEREKVLANGMNNILTKPILSDALYALLARYLLGRSTPAEPDAGENGTSPMPPDDNSASGFDLPAALARVNGNRDMLIRFLHLFLERNRSTVHDIRQAINQADLASARRLAHAFKGGAGTVGAVALQAAAAQLENSLATALQDNTPPQALTQDLALLESSWTQARQGLQQLLDAPD